MAECTCAMTEATMRTCAIHGEDDWREAPDSTPEREVDQ